MREIKEVNKGIEEKACQNVAGFDHTELCYKTIFDLMNDNGVFVKVLNELTTCFVEDKKQIKLQTFKYGFIQEEDGKIYPLVDLILWLKDMVSDFGSYYCLSLTPFNASLNNLTKDTSAYSGRDKELTKIWRVVMKGFFKDEYVAAFKKYCEDLKCLKESEIATKAEMEYEQIEREFKAEIGSI